MAKNNKNKNRLVTEDEPTTELNTLALEAASGHSRNRRTESVEMSGDLVAGKLSASPGDAKSDDCSAHRKSPEKALPGDHTGNFSAELESNAGQIPTTDTQNLVDELQTELASREKTIARLRFANEQFHSKQQGLEAELKARREIVDQLHRDCRSREDQLAAQRSVLETRDQFIEQLKKQLRHLTRANGNLLKKTRLLDREYRSLRIDPNDSSDKAGISEDPARIIGGQAAKIAELRAQLQRTEDYASKLRAVLFNRENLPDESSRNRTQLRTLLAVSAEKLSALEAELQKDHETCTWLRQRLAELQKTRVLEVQAMQTTLDETQEALAEAESATQELASDLVETRDYRDRLSTMLKRTEDQAKARIAELERDNARLIADLAHHEEKLDARGRAITDLLAELAKKPQPHDSASSSEDAPNRVDQRTSDRPSYPCPGEKDRFTRLLVGTVDGQEIRFPLFKNRLTIGRSAQNDIQLKAAFVSRRHAVLVTDLDKARIVDWGSRNGVFVNSNRISEHFLINNDVITIGVVNFRYEERPKR